MTLHLLQAATHPSPANLPEADGGRRCGAGGSILSFRCNSIQCGVVRYCDYCEQAVVRIMQPRGERMVKGAEHGSGHGAGPGAGQNGVEQLGEGQSMETIVEAVQQAVKQVHS